MKRINALCWLVLFATASFNSVALADRGHGSAHEGYHGGGHSGLVFYFGAPFMYPYYPSYYYYPYPYYPQTIVVPNEPQEYIEQGDAIRQVEPQAKYYWYHCNQPEGYYPYIKECPSGWQPVDPIPPPPK